jgi:hypothetical protein
MMLHKAGVGTALTSVAANLANITINIPAQKGGVTKFIDVIAYGTEETVVNRGGLLAFHNSSAAHWEPLEVLAPGSSVITEGGAQVVGQRYYVEKELPGNSSVTVDVTPYDNQSQIFAAVLNWELAGSIREEHFIESIHPLKASAVTSTARASPGNVTIPGGLGGRAIYLYDCAWPTLETIVNSGGLRELECDAIDIKPCEQYVSGVSAVDAGGANIKIDQTPTDFPVKANSVFTSYYTPQDNQSQTLSTLIHWVRPTAPRVG